MLHKFVTAIAFFAIAAVVPVEARTLDEIITDGTIRIGVNPNFPPMSFTTSRGNNSVNRQDGLSTSIPSSNTSPSIKSDIRSPLMHPKPKIVSFRGKTFRCVATANSLANLETSSIGSLSSPKTSATERCPPSEI